MSVDPAPAAVSLRKFSFRHVAADRLALDGVTLEVGRGEFVGVLGATGAGVSTLLTALDGVVPQLVHGEAGGSIRVDGLDPLTVPVREMARRVGLVFDDPELAASQPTVADEVAFGLENLGLARSQMEPRITEALGVVGLAGLADRDPATLSGGELQRLAIASAVAAGPAILVLDEPSANLDPAGRRAVYGILHRLNRERGITILVADRDVELIAASATRVVVLDGGRVVGDGTPTAVLGDPAALARHAIRSTEVAEIATSLGVPAPAPLAVDGALGWLRLRGGATPASGPRPRPADVGSVVPLVDLQDVTFRYPGAARPAVAGVTLAVRPGEVVGFVGPNGGGKTTLGRLVNGLLRPQRGRVVVDGLDTAGYPVRTLARHVASVFQEPAHQLFAPTVAEELSLGPRALGVAEAQVGERVRELAGLLGLEDVLGRHPLRLGRAERKVVALAAVLAMRPRVLILDEPTTGHDSRLAELVADRIRASAGDGTAVLVASHDMSLLAGVADRLVVMDGGRVIADAPPRLVFSDAALLARAGLEAPQATRLAMAVAVRGAGAEAWPPITVAEAVAALALSVAAEAAP